MTGDAFEFLKDQPRNAKLADIASEFANRYVTTNHLAEAHDKLDKFKREKDESIRVVKIRLDHLVRKALIIHPKSEQPGIKDSTLRQKLKQMVHQKTLAAIEKRENEYRNQGLTIPIDDLVNLIDEEERRYGKPKYPVNVPIALYNTEVQQTMVPENLDDDILEIEAELNNLCNNTEVNAAVAGRVRFQDKKDAL